MSFPGKPFDSLARSVKEAESRAFERAEQISFEMTQNAARRMHEENAAHAEQANLARRTAAAVEASAKLAEESKRGSDAAVMWARVAALISLAALVVSAWPYITEWWN